MKLNQYIDHTILKANATESDVVQLCDEARQHAFFSVCINSAWVPTARKLLEGSPVKVCSVIGFPLGAMSTAAKVFEAKQAVADGADEIDMVINVGWLKDGKDDAVREEIRAIKTAIGANVLKVIIETCYLSDAEKVRACQLSVAAGADFVKTSTGFGTGGATVEDVQLMLDAVQGKAKVKASGGVRDAEAAMKYVQMGVMRLGTSNGIKIVAGEAVTGGY
ncbi:MAG: deoxyribose-phosphate aldolase [Propionivibrio sp.]